MFSLRERLLKTHKTITYASQNDMPTFEFQNKVKHQNATLSGKDLSATRR